MSWNYRVIKRTWKDGIITFAIHSVHYDESGHPTLVSVDPQYPQGDDLNELISDLGMYALALEKKVIPYEYFDFKDKKE